MDLSYLLSHLLLAASLCVGTVWSADNLLVEVEESLKRTLKVGDSTIFNCTVNQGFGLILTHDVIWVHHSLISGQDQLLTIQMVLQPATPPDKFDILIEQSGGSMFVTLTLKNVEVSDDGQFICCAEEKSTKARICGAPVDVGIAYDVQQVNLEVNKQKSTTSTSTQIVELEEGEYPVYCEAKGYSPGVDIQLYLDNQKISISKTERKDDAASMAANARRYTAIAGVSRLDLTADDTGKTLSCMAVAAFEGAKEVSASVAMRIFSLEPIFHCENNISVPARNKYVKLSCILEHPDVAIEKIMWVYGESGQTMEGEHLSQNYDESKVESINTTHTKATLVLYEITEDSFGNYFLDVQTEKGKTFRESIILLEDTTSSASATTSTAVIITLLLLVL